MKVEVIAIESIMNVSDTYLPSAIFMREKAPLAIIAFAAFALFGLIHVFVVLLVNIFGLAGVRRRSRGRFGRTTPADG